MTCEASSNLRDNTRLTCTSTEAAFASAPLNRSDAAYASISARNDPSSVDCNSGGTCAIVAAIASSSACGYDMAYPFGD